MEHGLRRRAQIYRAWIDAGMLHRDTAIGVLIADADASRIPASLLQDLVPILAATAVPVSHPVDDTPEVLFCTATEG